MEKFFGIEESGYVFRVFGLGHILFLISFFFFIKYIINETDDKKILRLKNIAIFVILIQQVALYLWYFITKYVGLSDALPLYNCRFAMIILIISNYVKNENLKKIGIWWGMIGSVIAFIYPVLDPFGIYHFTFYSFFIGHIGLLITCITILKLEGYGKYYNRDNLKNIIGFSTIYHLIIILINNKLNGNYCYMNISPIDISIITNLNRYYYNIFAILLFDFVLTLSYLFSKNKEILKYIKRKYVVGKYI